MIAADQFVYRNARNFVELHGDGAVARAREQVADLQARGDRLNADMWLRVIIAIEEMQRSGTDTPA